MKKKLHLLLVSLLLPLISFSQVVINEICIGNGSTITNFPNEYEDWIELYNGGSSAVNLNGYSISDNILLPKKWVFPNVSIPAKGYLMIWASEKDLKKSIDTLHTNFKISDNEPLVLYSNTNTLLDSKIILDTKLDHSFGRTSDGLTTWGFFDIPTPKKSNNTATSFATYNKDTLQFSHSAGFYNSAIQVSVTGGNTIRYTTDGSEPTTSSNLYTAPISISKTTVLKVAKFDNGQQPFKPFVATYFIGENITLPVFSISTKPSYFFDYNTGIYVKGPNASSSSPYFGANFWQDWERPLYVEYFDKNKIRQISQLAGVRIQGNYSRGNDQKSLLLMAKSKYGKDHFKEKFFTDKNIKSFEDIILRNSGGDYNITHFRDGFLQTTIGQFTGLDYMAYKPSVIFLNGEYWGIQNIREKISTDFIAENNGISKGDVDLVETWGTELAGTNNIWGLEWNAANNDMTQASKFKAVADSFDLNKMIDYFASEIYIGNWDWPNNNIKYWRNANGDRKYKMILWDLDLSLGLFDLSKVDGNNLDTIFKSKKSLSPTASIFKNLNKNIAFRNQFINRYADLMNSIFVPSKFKAKALAYKDSIAAEMPRHLLRWPGYDTWDNHIKKMTDFMDARPSYARAHLQNQFGLTKQVNLTLEVQPAGAGYIKINSIYTDVNTWTGVYYDGVPVTITAIPNPGYTFERWQSPTLIATPVTNRVHTLNISTNEKLTAYFTGTKTDLKLTLSEINFYSPTTTDAGDWIELHNNGTSSIDLSDWSIKDQNDYNKFTFPFNTILLPNQRVVLCSDSVKFKNVHGNTNKVLGQLSFGFDNQSDEVRIFDNKNNLFQRIAYSSSKIWDNKAYGQGYSLELKDSNLDPQVASNWSAGCIKGTPFDAYNSNCPQGIEDELSEENLVQVVPNPNNGLFKLVFYNNVNIESINVLNAQGISIWETNIKNESNIDIQNLPSGIYFLRIKTATGKNKTLKVLKNE